MAEQKVRDPVHDFIHYDETEEAVINSAPFQRLRGIRQLAMASLVYPGATHTRFEHSLGVMDVAGRVAEQVKLPDDAVRVVRLAGLLHDIGHGPFSHVSEHPLSTITAKHSSAPDVATKKLHECITTDIIRTNAKIREAIGEDTANAIANLLDPRLEQVQSVEKQIVSGPLDADKFDYLLRDSYCAGVRYGIFDLARMIETLRRHEQGDETHLAVAAESVWATEQYIMASYHMMAQVYSHRIRRISDRLLVRAIEYAAEDGVGDVRRVYTYAPGDVEYLDLYLSYDDARLFSEIEAAPSGNRAAKLVQCLRRRELPRPVWEANEAELPYLFVRRLEDKATGPCETRDIEEAVASACEVDGDLVVVDLFSVDPPEPTSHERSVDAEEVLVLAHSGKLEPFDQHSAIFDSRPSPPSAILSVYVPLKGNTRAERKQEREALRSKVASIVDQMAGGSA